MKLYKGRGKVSSASNLCGLYKLLILFAVFFVCGNAQIHGAVVIETVASQGDFTTGGARTAPITIPNFTVSGISRVLYVAISSNDTTLGGAAGSITNAGVVTSVTFAGQPLMRVNPAVGNAVASIDGKTGVEVFRIVNPAVLNGDIEVTVPAIADYVVVGALSMTGVDQTNPNGTLAGNTGNSTAPSVSVATNSGDLVLDTLAADFSAGFFTVGMSQTIQYRGNPFFGFLNDLGAGSTKTATGTSTQMNWTLENTSSWALGGLEINALAPTASSASVSGRVLSNSGRGLGNVFVSIVGSDGKTRFARTNPFGYYRFNDVEVGDSYILQARSKRYRFAAQILNVNDNLSNVNLMSLGR